MDRGRLLDAYRSVLASAFGLVPVSYRLEHGLGASDAQMAVGCLRMVEARCSGILFTRDFTDPTLDRLVLCAVSGLADGIAGGTASGEEIVVCAQNKDPQLPGRLSPQELDQLTRVARRIEAHFLGPQNIEWAFDDSGQLFVLQTRTVTPSPVEEPPQALAEELDPPLLTGGHTGCPGAGGGPVFVARSETDLDLFPDQGVLVTPHSTPSLSRIMPRCAAIIAEKGSPTGHMAILSREFGVPTLVGIEGAVQALQACSEVTVDATSRRVYRGLVPSLIRQKRTPPRADSPARRKLREASRFITPLRLLEPASPEFTPASCQSLHDITRFVHEKLFRAVFRLADKTSREQPSSIKLEGGLPFEVWVFDLGGGLVEGARDLAAVSPGEVLSFPLRAFLEGLLDPRFQGAQPRAISMKGFMSVLGETMLSPPAQESGLGKPCFATISDRYMNFSTKAGYHFNTVDTYCGKSLNKNYIHFRFQGGGADEARRALRCQFLELVLAELQFGVKCRGDVVIARLEKVDRDLLAARLVDLGRLTLCTRQLDMLMDDANSPRVFAQAFLAGNMDPF